MKIIIVSDRGDRSYSFRLNRVSRYAVLLVLCALILAVVYLSYQSVFDKQDPVFSQQTSETWALKLASQADDIEQMRSTAKSDLHALTVQLADMKSRLLRLDALGERVAEAAELDRGEFDFDALPAVGGPQPTQELDYQPPAFIELMNQMSADIKDREQQLRILDEIMISRDQINERYISGRPIVKGWMSSSFGHRTDPFTGRIAMHNGVDFAGKEGSSVIAVAGGVVTWASRRSGYGNLVEINHGNGYITRYGHNASIKASVGDVVNKGDTIALMGSTGRSTGPHVHYEVLKDGKKVDPARYIYRAGR